MKPVDTKTNELDALEASINADIAAAADEQAIEAVRVAVLGKKGSVSEKLKTLGAMTPDERKVMGPAINGLRDRVAEAIGARKDELKRAAIDARLIAETVDVTLPVRDPAAGTEFFYIPGCAEVDPPLARRIENASLLFFDGTLFTDDEMLQAGLMPKTGKRMGHISVSGDDGSIGAMAPLGIGRKIYVHINNSNPILDENSDARRATETAGWEVGYDGMEVRL